MRKYTLLLSIVVHASAALTLVMAPLFAAATLPEVRDVVQWVPIRIATPPPAQGTPQAARRATPASPSAPAAPAPPQLAPLTAPSTTVLESATGALGPDPGASIHATGGDGSWGFYTGTVDGEGIAPPPDVGPSVQISRPSQPIRIGPGLVTPRKTKHVAPVYPPIAIAARREGDVILEAVIAEDGSVRDVKVIRSIELLNAAAVDAVRQWRFAPTLLSGVPVPIVMTVIVNFRLR